MSEKSFAVITISAAVICGIFFYPEPPHRAKPMAAPTDDGTPGSDSGREKLHSSSPQTTVLTDEIVKANDRHVPALVAKSSLIKKAPHGSSQ